MKVTAAPVQYGVQGTELCFKRLKNWVLYHAVAGLVRLLRLVPLRWTAGLGTVLGSVAWLVAGRERRRALGNLRLVWPRLPVSRQREIVRRMFSHLGQSAMECVALDRLKERLDPGPDQVVSLSPGSLQALTDAVARGRGVLFVTGHVGNWELLGAAVARVAQVSVLFKPSYDPRFTAMMLRFREKLGIMGIDVTCAAHLGQALRALRQGRVLGILLDQPPPSGSVLPFFGQPAPTSNLVEVLARRTGAAVVAGFIHRQGLWQHRVTVQRVELGPPGMEEPGSITSKVVRELERAILKQPEQWIWSLDRWRNDPSASKGSDSSNLVTKLYENGDKGCQ